jgi:hypothetical protein
VGGARRHFLSMKARSGYEMDLDERFERVERFGKNLFIHKNIFSFSAPCAVGNISII